ncbi:glycosyl transferase [Sphingobacterium cellulitidis]|uniref:sulfatase-like hydrolase/transferase n=1 Tax=Sphingobacterium cellulitidis TaxID=1768011 RepID=UPI000B945CD6|nr:sulfatase-like hydrolase/transferase [Sphingobacterium cellulitidis]OYD45404.1 glycosyl transferase [Sphingobacterium cellulitidis]
MAEIIYEIIVWLFLIYSIGIFSVYTWIALFSYGAVLRYKHGNIFTDYSIIASNPNAPSFSLIAPAYNEGMTVVENVRSLLSIYYHKLEIIIVNDGSKDDSIARLIEAYQLEKVSYIIPGNIPTKEVLQVYKSKNPAFKKLIVVDKVNGGKADALNVGINISKSDYIVCIDVDCIIEQDAILRLAKPFMEQTDKRLIACGGTIRLANNCKVENGKVVEVNLPKSWLGRSQALEYIRAFVLGRMAWSRASGLILISGAFGAFDKEIVLACGGYDPNTVGEDMELVVRMRRYMKESKLPHQVITIPDPLCWTEVPEDKAVLKKQRNRWMRGTMETLWKHRKMMFNPRYGKMGMLSLPYWFFFEFLGPFIEFSGYIIFWIFLFAGLLNWTFFLALFALVLFSSILYSVYAISVDLVSYQVYTKRKDLTKLILTAVIEPFYFHPIVTMAGIRGMIDYFRKNNSWGEMTRRGFSDQEDETFKQKAIRIAKSLFREFSSVASVFMILISVFSILEFFIYKNNIPQFAHLDSFFMLLLNNILIGFVILMLFFVIYGIISLFNRHLSILTLQVLASVLLVSQLVLAFYFAESRNLLGTDLFFYSSEELRNILLASGVLNWLNILGLIIGLGFLFFVFHKITKKYQGSGKLALGFLCISAIALGYLSLGGEIKSTSKDEFLESAEKSKLGFFIESNAKLLMDDLEETLGITKNNEIYAQVSGDYPFLKVDQTKDILGPLMNHSDSVPNLVLILVEGLGNAYSDPNGYIGDFTPFLNGLKDSSLVWENNLSSSGRTFSVLPTILGSLPFGNSGFLELNDYPNHFNLINILKHNGFSTSFFYGGDSEFDYMAKYLEANKVDALVDVKSFPEGYKKLPSSNGESWGYEDQAVLNQLALADRGNPRKHFHIALTLSTHNPFLINDAAKYGAMFDQRVQKIKLSTVQKKFALENRKQLISVLNVDDALREFFMDYQKRTDFNHTIFIITGDHSMPEIPLQSKIDRYHVPLIVYSPLLKSKRRFQQVVSHFDLAPTIMAYYKENYQLKVPEKVTWIGQGLDVGGSKKGFGIPIMQSKSQLVDFVYGDIHLNSGVEYQLNKGMTEDRIEMDSRGRETNEKFEIFKKMNRQFTSSMKLLPDSVFSSYFKP